MLVKGLMLHFNWRFTEEKRFILKKKAYWPKEVVTLGRLAVISFEVFGWEISAVYFCLNGLTEKKLFYFKKSKLTEEIDHI